MDTLIPLKVLVRYRELGGEILTVGSDAHKPEHLGRFRLLPGAS